MTDVVVDMMSESASAVSFADESMMGKWVVGTITKIEKSQQTVYKSNPPIPKFYDEEKTRPMWQYVFTLATDERNDDDDDGLRRLFAKGQLLGAVKHVLAKAGVTNTAGALGGMLGVRWSGYGEAKEGFAAPKQYEARFKPSDAVSDMAAEPEQEAQPEPQYDPDSEPF